jgi:hypothetical protein
MKENELPLHLLCPECIDTKYTATDTWKKSPLCVDTPLTWHTPQPQYKLCRDEIILVISSVRGSEVPNFRTDGALPMAFMSPHFPSSVPISMSFDRREIGKARTV